MKSDFASDITNIPPLVGLTLGQIVEVFRTLADTYGEDATLAEMNGDVVEIEIPLGWIQAVAGEWSERLALATGDRF